MRQKHDIVVIGGGTGGIMAAARIKRNDKSADIAIIEPAEFHYYQPAWTLVGANTYSFEKTQKPMSKLIPKGVKWIKEYANGFRPEENIVTLANGDELEYNYLIVSPGLVMAPELVPGLEEAMKTDVVCSNYTDPKKTWKVLRNFKGGIALFTQPTTPIKCGGAPQKIMYLAADYFKKSGKAKDTQVTFATNGSVIFGIPRIKDTLLKVVDKYDINLRFGYNLVEVDAKNQIAWYEMNDHEREYNPKDLNVIREGNRVGIKYDMMHLAPPQQAPDFIRKSSLANGAGWLDVDKGTLQHNKFKNIFGIGDAAGLPTAKTGAAIRKQVPVVIENIKRLKASQALSDKVYNGYSSCPIVTGYGKMVLAEFDYDNNFIPDPKLKQLLVFDSAKDNWRLWILKKYMLPYLYWNKMMKGADV